MDRRGCRGDLAPLPFSRKTGNPAGSREFLGINHFNQQRNKNSGKTLGYVSDCMYGCSPPVVASKQNGAKLPRPSVFSYQNKPNLTTMAVTACRREGCKKGAPVSRQPPKKAEHQKQPIPFAAMPFPPPRSAGCHSWPHRCCHRTASMELRLGWTSGRSAWLPRRYRSPPQVSSPRPLPGLPPTLPGSALSRTYATHPLPVPPASRKPRCKPLGGCWG